MLEPFELPFVQRGLIEVLILAVPAGLLGTWIVLRGLAFFSHAVGTAAFPGLVLADGLGFAAPLGAFAAALVFSAGNAALGRGRDRGRDSVVALVLVGCLAAGVILASDVFGSGANVETLLFGSLLLVDGGDIALAALAATATVVATALVGGRWLAQGFDPGATSSRWDARLLDAALLGLIALASTAALSVVGALLVSALFVVPAATARLLTRRMRSWQLASIALVAAEGTVGLWLSVKTDAPPGATIACVAGAVFAIVALARAVAGLPRAALALAGATAVLALIGGGCGSSGSADGGQLHVVATTTQIGDWVGAVGGDAVAVDQVLQPNTDPHEYEPRPSDVAAAASAKLVFANGDNLDSWIDQIVADGGSDATVIDLGAGVPERLPGESGGEEASKYDPHWWHDPRNAEAAVREIERRLTAADPAHRREFERNARAYLASLRKLDARNRQLHRHGPGGAAQACHRPRRLRLLRPALRDRRRRRRDPLADDAGPALGQGPQRADRPDRARRGEGGLPRELAERQGGRRDRAPDRRLGRLHPLRRHARPGRLRRRHLPGHGGGERRFDGSRLHRREARVPAEPLIEAAGLAVGYGGLAGGLGRLLRAGGGGAAGPARSQWRRQDDDRCGRCSASCARSPARCGSAPPAGRCRRPSARASTTPSRRWKWRRWGRSRGCPGGAGPAAPTARRRARPCGRVGLEALAEETFGELSGGQRQRVLIARALVQDARVLLMDEPFTGLDRPAAERLEELIAALAQEGHGVVIATHDLEQARRWDSVLCVNRRQIAVGPPDRTLDREVLEATYGGAIVEIPGTRQGDPAPHHHHHH